MSEHTSPDAAHAMKLLETHIPNDALRHHCKMVAQAVKAYARAYRQAP